MPTRAWTVPKRSVCHAQSRHREDQPRRSGQDLLAMSLSRRAGAGAQARRVGPAIGHLDQIQTPDRIYTPANDLAVLLHMTGGSSGSANGTQKARAARPDSGYGGWAA